MTGLRGNGSQTKIYQAGAGTHESQGGLAFMLSKGGESLEGFEQESDMTHLVFLQKILTALLRLG